VAIQAVLAAVMVPPVQVLLVGQEYQGRVILEVAALVFPAAVAAAAAAPELVVKLAPQLNQAMEAAVFNPVFQAPQGLTLAAAAAVVTALPLQVPGALAAEGLAFLQPIQQQQPLAPLTLVEAAEPLKRAAQALLFFATQHPSNGTFCSTKRCRHC
jgi:hypothetical protein